VEDRLPLLSRLALGWDLGEDAHSALRRRVRVHLKRNPQPSAAIVDSQSVKTTGVGGKERGIE
jgi:putative transposase